jgi:hypothetical protein
MSRDIKTHSLAGEKEAMDDIEAQELGISDEERKKRKRVLDRRSGADLKKRWEQGDREELERREQDLAPPRVSEARCHVCQSPYRDFIEEALVKGHSYERIAKKLPPDPDGDSVSSRSISNHFKEHMDLQRQAIREELEEEARAISQNVEAGALGAKTDRGILKVLVAKGFDDVIRGVSTVEPKDLIQIIKLLNELNNNASTSRAEENEVALRTFVRAIENVCPPEMIKLIVTEAERIRNMDDVEFAMEGIIIRDDRQTVKVVPLELEPGDE